MPSSLRAVVALLLLSAFAVAAPFSGVQEVQPEDAWSRLEGSKPCHVRVTWWSEPESSGTISWSTADETDANHVELSALGEEQLLRFESSRDGRFSGSEAEGGVYYHHARYAGLEPDTTYELVVDSDGERSATFHFRTAPVEDEPFTLLYGGDSRTMHANRLRMNRLIRDRVAAEPELLAFIHGGDYVMDGRRWWQWRLWLSHHEVCTAPDGRLLPVVPARGNHDWGLLYDEVFDDPGGREKNFGAIALGPELAVVTLNTNISTAGEQAEWMESALPRLRASHRWLFVQYHRPMWPALKAPSEAKGLWVPLFEKSDVDLVMESDGHALKRTVPIRDDKFDPTGVTYIGEGGLGAPLRRPRRDLWYLQPPGMVSPGLHISMLDVSAEGVVIRTLGPPQEDEELLPELVDRVLLGTEAPWAWSATQEAPEGWLLGEGAAAGWARGRPAQWHLAEGAAPGLVCRAWVALDEEQQRGVRELGLLAPRGVELVAWLDGVEVARRTSWRGGNPWEQRDERFGEHLVEYVELRLPESGAPGPFKVLAVELVVDPRASAGAGPELELLANPVRDEVAERAAPVLDLWKLAPRASLTPR